MIIRYFNILFSFIVLIFLSPLLILSILLVWSQDGKNPFYLGIRVGKNRKLFKMIKLRSMKFNADKGQLIPQSLMTIELQDLEFLFVDTKVDEIFQLLNVIKGDMDLVGPRPNVVRDVELYTKEEMKILSVLPGITDFSSIVFSDEGDILKGSNNPDLEYNKIIRPWKSRLALFILRKVFY